MLNDVIGMMSFKYFGIIRDYFIADFFVIGT